MASAGGAAFRVLNGMNEGIRMAAGLTAEERARREWLRPGGELEGLRVLGRGLSNRGIAPGPGVALATVQEHHHHLPGDLRHANGHGAPAPAPAALPTPST